MKLKRFLIIGSAFLSLPAFATDVNEANSLFRVLGEEIQQVLNLREVAEKEINEWYTSADRTGAATYCQTGYYGKGALKIGVPFKIGRTSACVKSYQRMGTELDGLTGLKSWNYLNRAYALPELARQTLDALGVVYAKTRDQAECFKDLYQIARSMTAASEYYNDPIRDEQLGQTDPIRALKFMNEITLNDRKVSDYLTADQASRVDLISRGHEIHFAIQALRMSIYNPVLPRFSKYVASKLNKGCEI